MNFRFGTVLLIFFISIKSSKININKYYSDVHNDNKGSDVENKFSFWKRDLEYILLMMMVMKK